MTDGDVILRAVLASPGDDLTRLAYADWLEESGELPRAELIRVQLEEARLHVCDCAPSLFVQPGCATCAVVKPLRRKAHKLLLGLTHHFRPLTGYSDRKSTRLNSSHITISYAVFCLKKKIHLQQTRHAIFQHSRDSHLGRITSHQSRTTCL